MEIEVISTEIITPSVPTPSHLRNFSLSLLDQTFPAVYIPVIIFYDPIPIPSPECECECDGSSSNMIMNISTRLKASLSEALSRFYPLAGRIKGNISIDCNDQGALFVEVKVVNCDLSEFLKQPNLDLLHHFLPNLNVVNTELITSAFHLAIQLNIFPCGGISIGISFMHKIIDAVTMVSFLNLWAASAANPDNIPNSLQPNDDDLRIASKLFPPKPSIPEEWMISLAPHLKVGKGARRRFVFDAEAISTLKSKHFPTLVVSRLLVVSSFLLKHVMAAVDSAAADADADAALCPSSSVNHGVTEIKRYAVVCFRVNMRSRMIPPLPQYCIGNLIYPVLVQLEEKNINDMDDDDQQLEKLVELKKCAVGKINNIYLTSLEGEQGFEQIGRDHQEKAMLFSKEDVNNTYIFNSWCKMGFNELDFGWGKPVWVSRAPTDIPGRNVNACDFLDTVCGDGIEAWLQLSEAAMNILERDQEFLTFASLNPPIVLPQRELA